MKVIEKNHFAYQDAAAEGTSDEEFRKGKRADHDRLPEEIQALYVENLELLHRMREVHLKLRSLSLQQVSCPDSERYPFLKEIIELDKKSHENWKTYDHYVAGTDVDETAERPLPEDGNDEDTEDNAAKGTAADEDSNPAAPSADAPTTPKKKPAKNRK